MMGKSLILAQIALRNLLASRINWLIGGIIFFGTLLVVVGGALLDSMDRTMSLSITGSIAGQIQIYSGKSKDKLSLFGGLGGDPDLSPMVDFSKVRDVVAKVANVKTVVPMGISVALVSSGNTIDIVLGRLRQNLREQAEHRDDPAALAELAVKQQSLIAHVRHIISVLSADQSRLQEVRTAQAIDADGVKVLAEASSDAFWQKFAATPLDGLEFLENKLAPLLADADAKQIRYIGTDLDLFQKSFDRMRIVDGTEVPPGHLGFLFSKQVYESQFKLKNAHRLDDIKEDIEKRQRTIASDPDQQRRVKENISQTREILLQLDGLGTAEAVRRLRRALHADSKEQTATDNDELRRLLVELFTVDDQNFAEHYRIFYTELAPLLELYRLPIGGVLSIQAYTRSGYMQSINIKVYGTYEFKGLEDSALASGLNLIDLVSFRQLYGYLSESDHAEINRLKADAGLADISRADAEASLFGDDKHIVAEATTSQIDDHAQFLKRTTATRSQNAANQTYLPSEMDRGVALNAAVILKDPTRIDASMQDIERAAKAAGLDLNVVSWQDASGLLGQFVLLAKIVLYVAVSIIFIVALVVINNAMMMATLQRVQEIGTMRAIGAQQLFVLLMILAETLAIGLVAGAIGAGVGGVIVQWLHHIGIPAPNDALYFFFSGPRLFPSLGLGNLVVAFAIVLVVSAVSTFYPAFLATRIEPVRAMQTDE